MENIAVELKITFLKSRAGKKKGIINKVKKLKSYTVQNYILKRKKEHWTLNPKIKTLVPASSLTLYRSP